MFAEDLCRSQLIGYRARHRQKDFSRRHSICSKRTINRPLSRSNAIILIVGGFGTHELLIL